MKKFLTMFIVFCAIFLSSCGNVETNSDINNKTESFVNLSSNIDKASSKKQPTPSISNKTNSSSLKKQEVTSEIQINSSSKKQETQISSLEESVVVPTENSSSYDELTDAALFNQRFDELWNYMVDALNKEITELQAKYDNYSNYIAQNSTIDQTAYMLQKRQIDEQYANAGLTGSGQHQAALSSLEQQYLVEQNPTVISYRSELPEIEKEIEDTKFLLEDEAGLETFVISQLCEDFGYNEEVAYQMKS